MKFECYWVKLGDTFAPNVGRVGRMGRVGESRAQLGNGVLSRRLMMELVPVKDVFGNVGWWE